MSTDAPLSFGVFLTAATLLALVPGPGVLYVLARTLSGGKQDGIASTVGTGLGGLVHVVAAVVGLSALLAASAQAFAIVKYIGAAYLIFIGIRTVLSARTAHVDVQATRPAGAKRAFLEGILTEVLNVKTALFFLAFIPQFIHHDHHAAPQIAGLGLICVLLNTAVDLIVVFLAARLMPYLRRSPRPARTMAYGSGGVMVGLGAYLAFADVKR